MPFWDIDGNEMVLFGPLNNVLATYPNGVSIYLPEGYDINMPISNGEVRFSISGGSVDSCRKFLQDGVSPCYVDKGWMSRSELVDSALRLLVSTLWTLTFNTFTIPLLYNTIPAFKQMPRLQSVASEESMDGRR